MNIWAISDLHITGPKNKSALETIGFFPSDWLILAGDIAEKLEDIAFAFRLLSTRFSRIVWVPGNHELWTISKSERNLRGVARYEALIRLCREHGVISPEDPFPELTLGETDYVIAPCFLLYDYSFGPEGYSRQQVLDWASEHEIRCTDEYLLHTTPYESVVTWCAHRLTLTQERLGKIPSAKKIILVNHYPLIRELVHLPSIERFIVWCGTDATKNWHKQYNIEVAVYGHLHTPYTAWVDGVRFEEVSLGYHNQWSIRGDLNDHLRRIWPPPMPPTFKQGSKSVIRRP